MAFKIIYLWWISMSICSVDYNYMPIYHLHALTENIHGKRHLEDLSKSFAFRQNRFLFCSHSKQTIKKPVIKRLLGS